MALLSNEIPTHIGIVTKKNKKELFLDKEFKRKDDVTNKEIIKRIIKYALPVIIINLHTLE